MALRGTSVALAALIAAAAACGGNATSQPATAPSTASAVSSGSASDTTVSFSGLRTNNAPVTSYTETGIQVSMTAGSWRASTTYGNPAPFVEFSGSAGGTATGSLLVTLPTPAFFKSIDLYSSTEAISYVITGSSGGAVVFTLSGTQPNPFGNFHTLTNANQAPIDTLSIVLTDTSAPCCANPVGVDNIVFTNAPTGSAPVVSLTGSVTDAGTGAAIGGAHVVVATGPNAGASATTDGSGTFTLTGLAVGSATIMASATNYLSTSQTVAVGAPSTVAFQLKPDPNVTPTPTPPAGATMIGFNGLTTNGAPVATYSESGYTVSATTGSWTAVTTYGHPAPFIEFYAGAGTTQTGQVNVTAGGGATFTFTSVDVYSSTTTIPYVITGLRSGASVFTLTGTVPNTFGAFRTVVNSNSATAVDTLTIALTNAAAACCRNPMGVDNIVVTSAASTTSRR